MPVLQFMMGYRLAVPLRLYQALHTALKLTLNPAWVHQDLQDPPRSGMTHDCWLT